MSLPEYTPTEGKVARTHSPPSSALVGSSSGCAQCPFLQGYDGFVVQLDVTMSSDLERNILSASISQSVSILSQTYVTTASLNTLSSSIATTDSASQHLIAQLSSSVQATTGDFSASVASQFSSSYANIYSISSSINTSITNLSSSVDTTITNLSSSVATSISASEANVISISSSIHTSISSSDARFATFSSSINTTIKDKMNAEGVISSSAQLTGATLKGITIAPINSDGYSLIVSGALAVVNATGLPDGTFGDTDSTVPAQIYLDGNPTTASVPPPPDPSTNNQPNSNMIDMGDF